LDILKLLEKFVIILQQLFAFIKIKHFNLFLVDLIRLAAITSKSFGLDKKIPPTLSERDFLGVLNLVARIIFA